MDAYVVDNLTCTRAATVGTTFGIQMLTDPSRVLSSPVLMEKLRLCSCELHLTERMSPSVPHHIERHEQCNTVPIGRWNAGALPATKSQEERGTISR